MKPRLAVAMCAFILAMPCFGQDAKDVVVPGENLVVDGIPPIPVSLAEDVGRYGNFRSATISSWHPAKREMLIGTRFADTVQVHLVKGPGAERSQVTFFRDAARGALFQPTNGDSFIFTKDRGGDEFYQFYRYDFSTGAITLLTDGKSRNTGPVWSNSGEQIAYGSTRRNGADVDLYLEDPADPKTDKMLAKMTGGGWSALDWSPDDRTILLLENISANESYLWLCDAASGALTPITLRPPVGEQIAYNGGQFSKDGKGIYTVTDKDSEFLRLTYIDLATKQHTYLTEKIPWDVDNYRLSKDGAKIAFATNEDGISVLHLMDTASRRELAVPKLPAGVISDLRWHKNNRDLAFVINSARSPADVYSLDASTGKVERWTYSETGGVNTEAFPEPQIIHWKTFDGRTISGFLYAPPAKFSGKRPVVVDIHGGPEGQSRPTFQGELNYFVEELGVTLIQPNVRGSTGYGKSFLALDNGILREGSYKDIDALFDWIGAQPQLDSERIMVMGGSYGGHMTLAVSTFYSNRIRCSFDIVGMSNLVTFLEHTQAYRRDLRRVKYGDERDPKMREFLERIAPMNNTERIKKPMLVVAGKNDPRVPASESQQIVEALKKNGTPVWFLMANDEGHGFAKKKNSDFMYDSAVEFMKTYLLN
ncbi:MAG TPA: S9 family peptidase [Candidatus Acidoferrales bacterium]|nr:S9 family peptidase [Candidatus Acidoferrales bacterium]